MPYFISLEKLVEDRIPNGMWVMKDIKKLYAGWDFNLETQYLLHYNNMHNYISVKKDLLFFLL